MFAELGVAGTCLTLIQGSLQVGESAQKARRATEHSEQAALVSFLDAISDALIGAQCLAASQGFSSAIQNEKLLLAGGTLLPEGFTPLAIRPVMQLAFGVALASELVAQNAMHHDVRGVIEALRQLVRSTTQLRRSSDDPCFEAALELLRELERVYASLPDVPSPWDRLGRRRRLAVADEAFRQSTAAAWRAHQRLSQGRRKRVVWYRPRKEFRLPEQSTATPGAALRAGPRRPGVRQ
jgi:hypothetical protein